MASRETRSSPATTENGMKLEGKFKSFAPLSRGINGDKLFA
jgi:hypothetical protein